MFNIKNKLFLSLINYFYYYLVISKDRLLLLIKDRLLSNLQTMPFYYTEVTIIIVYNKSNNSY